MNKLPTLYKKDQKGRIRQWSIGYDNDSYTQEHGLLDGKLQTTSTKIKQGKNIGRANETTVQEQCALEAQSLWKKQKNRRGYSESVAEAKIENDVDVRPMLAKSYDKDGHKIEFPCYAQPKLDGIRCIAIVKKDGVKLVSRQNKEWTILKHIEDEIKERFPIGTILDGELYIHGCEFQEIVSAIKRDSPTDKTQDIEYHIYDLISSEVYGLRYIQLQQWINDIFVDENSTIKLVPNYMVKTKDEIELLHNQQTKGGYEGIILRNINGLYKCGGRSADLQKVKKFIDMEFMIVGAEENIGKMAGQCTFKCITKDGIIFGVKPKGDESLRKQYWIDWQDGKLTNAMLTVRFFSWTTSEKPVPRFPIGITIRDYE